jgi:hypothetical protein
VLIGCAPGEVGALPALAGAQGSQAQDEGFDHFVGDLVASQAARPITNQELAVDGGFSVS